MLQCYQCRVSYHLTAGGRMMIQCKSGELRCTEDGMLLLGFNGRALQARLTLTVNCSLPSCIFFTGAFNILDLWTSPWMDIRSHNQCYDRSFGSLNIHSVRIQLCLHSKHWELRSLWVSAAHGWGGVASHLAKSLSRICLLRISLSGSSSFERARTCRSYFKIWKHQSKHTT